jgi:hypothetical protein
MSAVTRGKFLLAAGSLMLIAVTQLGAQDGPTLRVNPFDRPEFVMTLGQVATPDRIEPVVELRLRATLVGDEGVIANINGRLLGVGDTYEGYTVQRIREGRVVMRSASDQLVLDVYLNQQPSLTEARRD